VAPALARGKARRLVDYAKGVLKPVRRTTGESCFNRLGKGSQDFRISETDMITKWVMKKHKALLKGTAMPAMTPGGEKWRHALRSLLKMPMEPYSAAESARIISIMISWHSEAVASRR